MSFADKVPKIKEDIEIKEEIIYTDRSQDNHPTVEIFEIEQIKLEEQSKKRSKGGRNRKKQRWETEYNRENKEKGWKNDVQAEDKIKNSWEKPNSYLSSCAPSVTRFISKIVCCIWIVLFAKMTKA